jgi:recombination protein RecA
MATRARVKLASGAGNGAGGYFPPASPLRFIETGCTLLDCVLGGGWPLGRVANIVGDKAVGKTLLAIEACANFSRQYPDGLIWYREAEAAFDVPYAESVGLPVNRVDFGPDGPDTAWNTIEDIFEDLAECLALAEKRGKPGLYIIDSLDALTSRADLEVSVDKGYRLRKQAVLGQLFNHFARLIRQTSVCLIVISQLRVNIGVTFGEKYRRSGGMALDFYASQILWLRNKGNIIRKLGGFKKAVGVRVHAKCKKNKVSMPMGECEFIIRFGYGVDSDAANTAFLEEAHVKLPAQAESVELATLAKAVWTKREATFAPTSRKYATNA